MKRFLPSSDQTVFRKTRTKPTLERVALLSEVIIKSDKCKLLGNDA